LYGGSKTNIASLIFFVIEFTFLSQKNYEFGLNQIIMLSAPHVT